MPKAWEDKTLLFLAHLIDKGSQSSTIKSYKSAIKAVLVNDGYDWKEEKILLTSLTKACRLINDQVKTKLPIGGHLLELLLFELERKFGCQPETGCQTFSKQSSF